MLLLILSLFTFSLHFQETLAQSDASCLPFYTWTFNSQDKTPCEVASSLLSVCNNGPFFVHALPDNSHYLGPVTVAGATPCECNTVVYSLMSACGACQGKTYLSWSVWSANCPTTYTSGYPEQIPQGVAVPGWAYLDVTANDNFDQTNARANANATESTLIVPTPTPTPVPTSSSLSSNGTRSHSKTQSHSNSSTHVSDTSTTASSSTPPPVPTSSAASAAAKEEAQSNLVGGAVVGSVMGAAIIIAIVAYFIQRRRRIARNGQILPSPNDSDSRIDDSNWQNREGPYMQQADSAPRLSAPSLNSSMHAPAIIVEAPRRSSTQGGHGVDTEKGAVAV
ncbi:hypothetical protein CVT24_011162 [Panaeolus cyanescens]|uniref:Mid2 domain-containing protein n=1 Tax=Panaeolus cyanescens TaxID=181874 RepID=A0A409YGB8_9AGAR|nr:hypothetical protein CVT24_011162 [Panaeolus cyanescens]